MKYLSRECCQQVGASQALVIPSLLGLLLLGANPLVARPDPQFGAPVANPFGLTAQTEPSGDFGDLDGDGDLDLVVSTSLGAILHFRNTGNSTAPAFAAPITIRAADGQAIPSVELADINGDGDLDIWRGTTDGYATQINNTGNSTNPGFFPPSGPILVRAHNGIRGYLYSAPASARLSVADIDGDGDFDILMGTRDGSFTFSRNTSSFQQSAVLLNPFGIAERRFDHTVNNSFPELVDVDVDGDLDLLTGSRIVVAGSPVAMPVRFQRNIGTAAVPLFEPFVENPFGLPASPPQVQNSLMMADLDADGDVDLLTGGLTNFYYYQNSTPLDTTAPTVTFSPLLTPPYADVITVMATFSENVVNSFTASDVTVPGTLAIKDVNVLPGPSPVKYLIHVRPMNPDASGVIRVAITGSVFDAYNQLLSVPAQTPIINITGLEPGICHTCPPGDVSKNGTFDLADVALLADANLSLVTLP